MIRFQVPVGHPVVQEDTGIAGDKARPEGALQALQLANRVAPPIHDDKTSRIFFSLTSG
jgi:hypothetical protein